MCEYCGSGGRSITLPASGTSDSSLFTKNTSQIKMQKNKYNDN